MTTASAVAKQPRPSSTFGFGGGTRIRRKPMMAMGGKSDQDLIADFLASREVTKCAPRYADGSVRSSGEYDF